MGAGVACVGLLAAGVAGAVAIRSGSSDAGSGAPSAVGGPHSAAGGHAPLRLFDAGDSEANTFTVDLSLANPAALTAPGTGLFDGGQDGCGVVIAAQFLLHGVAGPPPAPCDPNTPVGEQWPALDRAAMAKDHPNVMVLLAGRIEIYDHRNSPNEKWQNILQPAGAAYVKQQVELAAQIGIDNHAHVLLATAPYYSSGKQPNGKPWPEDNPARVRAYNHLLRQVAAAHRGQVSILDMNALVCPGGKYRSVIDGVTVRAGDGVHYTFFNIAHPYESDPDTVAVTERFSHWLAPRVIPKLQAAAG